MKRRNEFLVGLSVVGAIAAVVLGAIFLSDSDVGRREVVATARFRSVGGLQPGAPVMLRGVRIGRVEALRLADNAWVEADLRVARAVDLPDDPVVIAVSASLFGEWQAAIVGRREVTDPQVTSQLDEAARQGGGILPGADLPDIGELTAQAARIASNVGFLTERVGGAVDSTVIADLRASVSSLRDMAERLNQFSADETSTLSRITGEASRLSTSAAAASEKVNTTFGRIEEATRDGRLDRMMGAGERVTVNLDSITADLRTLSAVARDNRETMVRVIATLDTVLRRVEAGRGTLGMLSADSTLYLETTRTVAELRALLADIRINPRKYFRFSVF